MPELPETETMARDLHRSISGRSIVRSTIFKPDVLRETDSAGFSRRTVGSLIRSCVRRAKLVVLVLSNAERIVIQPRFTGAILVDEGALPEAERRYSTLALALDDGRAIHYRDIRRLGTVTVMSEDRWEAYESGLGIEPLDLAFSKPYLSAIFRGSAQAVKKVLMDQRRVAGIGNIYANEALWSARVDPSRAARSLRAPEVGALHTAIVDVLRRAIDARGTSFRDYRDARGERGHFAEQLAVYGRGGLPCPRCGARLINTSAIDGRTSVFCARCQS